RRGHRTRVGSVCLSPEGRRLVSMDVDGTKLVWDAQTGQRLNEPPPRTPAAHSLPSPEGELFAHIDRGTVRLMKPPDAEELLIRRARTRLDPAWHREQADLRYGEKNFLAAAFHFEQALAAQP